MISDLQGVSKNTLKGGRTWMKRVINIVEDERDLNELVKRYLEKENYEVRSYLTFDEASMHTGDSDVHLWILDIMLGDKSGFDLIEDIRTQNPDVPVIFMSARDKEFDRIIGLEKGSDDYITKPFSPKELVLRVNNIMRRTYRSTDDRLVTDGYSIDENKRIVYDAESREIDLTTKEYELLMLFVKNRGMAFSREQILERVWETNYYGSDRVVDDTLRRLRRKMPDLSIHTIYGFGYRLG
jgi:two-component system response regulator CssR